MPQKDLDALIIEAARELLSALEEVELRSEMEALLSEVPEEPEGRRRVANRILNASLRHPRTWRQLRERLGLEKRMEEVRARLFEVIPGGPGEVPAGTLMVCPVDPSHYRKRLRQKGEVLFCPEHGVQLVPLKEPSAPDSG